MDILFIRHAESESNAGLRTEHPATIRLTERGQTQAALTAETLPPPALIVTSPYLRTKQTAAPFLRRFPNAPQAEWPVQEFTFLNPAHWQGTTGQERWPSANAYWERGDPHYQDGEGAESFSRLMERVHQTRALIQSQTEGPLVIFSHGQFSRAFLWSLLYPTGELSGDRMRRLRNFTRGFPFPNCGILTYRLEDGRFWHSGMDTSHLPTELITY